MEEEEEDGECREVKPESGRGNKRDERERKSEEGTVTTL